MTMTHLAQAAQAAQVELPAVTEVGELGLYQLKRYWAYQRAAMRGRAPRIDLAEKHRNYLIVHAAGIGLEQTSDFLSQQQPSFATFERWILATAGRRTPEEIARINAAMIGAPTPAATVQRLRAIDDASPALSDDDLAFWDKHGYVVVHDAVPAESRDAAAQALCEFIGARLDEPETWYPPNAHGIMVQYFQHPAFEANRRSARLHKAFAQLWGTSDLWPTTDRVGFNAPERPDSRFRGPDLHWDVSVKTPIPFGTQGILYLTDTTPEQGAFTLVPGFHRWGEDWLARLPPGADPRRQDLHALGSQPIGGRAGDLVIWHQALPHGASPNRAERPRLVQYINMFPAKHGEQEEWL